MQELTKLHFQVHVSLCLHLCEDGDPIRKISRSSAKIDEEKGDCKNTFVESETPYKVV